MSKQIRRAVAMPDRKTVKCSVPLDVATHTRLCALGALRGVPIATIMAEAVAEAVRGIVVIDRRKFAGEADPPAPVIESGSEAA